MSQRIRIVSDLHIGHRASSLTCPSSLRELATDIDHLIFNGDTLELKYAHNEELERRFAEEVASWGIETTIITGNHDPSISGRHDMDLFGGAIYVTHGDALFETIAPWSSSLPYLKASLEILKSNGYKDSWDRDLATYLEMIKEASLMAQEMDTDYNPTLWGKLKIFLHQAWPPTRPFKILDCWRRVPGHAVAFAERFGKNPRFIIVGHTHNPGIWQKGSQVVINLGSFFPWPGARCVDIENGRLLVRKLHRGPNRIKIGPVLASFEL